MKRAELLWYKLEGFFQVTTRSSLCNGANDGQILLAENQLGFTLPEELRASFFFHNGQDPELHTGLLDGACLLSLAELVQESDAKYSQTFWIPVSEAQGNRQFVVHNREGSVYLISGWNTFKQASSWSEFLQTLYDR